MSGQPVARLGDATLKGGPIVQGAAGVMIGAINGKACSTCDERHYFIYDAQHRLNHYEKHEENHKIVETHYQYDPLGRRVSKVSEIYREGKLIEEPHYWYGWEGDRLVTTEHNDQRIHTIYDPSGFMPLIRLEQSAIAPTAGSLKSARRYYGSGDGRERDKTAKTGERSL